MHVGLMAWKLRVSAKLRERFSPQSRLYSLLAPTKQQLIMLLANMQHTSHRPWHHLYMIQLESVKGIGQLLGWAAAALSLNGYFYMSHCW